jgi:nucleotide-binding universal stress UspA family protein
MSPHMQTLNQRPRVLRWYHAGAMLFGDWGTSRLYVLGLAFYFSGQSSILLMMAMSVLLLSLAWAYEIISAQFLDSGGAYSAAAEISRPLAVVGGLLLFADYVMTAALSAVAAFHYLGARDPGAWAAVSIAAIGVLNLFGPIRAGAFAAVTSLFVISLSAIIGVSALPYLGQAAIRSPTGGPGHWWFGFTGIILAISGVESIANMTGIMVTPVERTIRRSVWPVAVEIVLFNVLLMFAVQAIPLSVLGEGDAGRAFTAHRDDMLSAVSRYYLGQVFASVASVGFAVLLLSAVNTAVSNLVSIQFRMAHDAELPAAFQKLNRWGMPPLPLFLAVIVPVGIVLIAEDTVTLSQLYSLSVCLVIVLHLLACVANQSLDLKPVQRIAFAAIGVLLAAMAVSVSFQNPRALLFVTMILAAGFGARWFARHRERVGEWLVSDRDFPLRVPRQTESPPPEPQPVSPDPRPARRVLVATEGDTGLLRFAAEQAYSNAAELIVVFVRHIAVDVPPLGTKDAGLDHEALRVQSNVEQIAAAMNVPCRAIYATATDIGQTVLDIAIQQEVDTLILGSSHRGRLWKVLKGDVIQTVADQLPKSIRLIVQA